MKSALFFISAFLLAVCAMQNVEGQKTADQKTEMPKQETAKQSKNYVLVELFTSEGCSSCPPADDVLTRLENEQPVKNTEIVPLALHVDYWNNLGWKDQFSSKDYSRRQSGYADKFNLDSIYTPQMVVDGQTQFVGSQFRTATDSIAESSKTKKADVDVSMENDKLKINISDLPTHDVSYVWLAITEDNLQTDVRRGENSGRKLSHTGVVREMDLLGNIEADKKDYAATAAVKLQPEWKRKNLNVVIFVQGQDSKSVFAIGKLKID